MDGDNILDILLETSVWLGNGDGMITIIISLPVFLTTPIRTMVIQVSFKARILSDTENVTSSDLQSLTTHTN